MSPIAAVHNKQNLPFLARLLRAYMRSGLRGQTRVTYALARRFESLRAVPITMAGCAPLYVDLRQDSAHQLLRGTPWQADPFDAPERAVMRRLVRPGDVVFDIGANIGLHAVLLSRLVGAEGKVYVFEPNPELIPTLRASVEAAGNGVCHACALSDKACDTTLFVPEFNLMASLADWTQPKHGAGPVRGVPCRMKRLDELVESGVVPAPDFVKCDVEGAELMVFRGARTILDREDAPILLFEVNKGASAAFGFGLSDAMDYLDALPSARFRFLRIEKDASLSEVGATEPPSFGNVLAVPASRIHRLPGDPSTA